MNTARRFSPAPDLDALARFVDTIDAVASQPAAGNAPPADTFRQCLADMTAEQGASGVRWRNTSLPLDLQGRVASLDRCAYAIDGLSRLWLASNQAAEVDGDGAGLGNYLQEMIGYGVLELAQQACRCIGDIVESYPEQAA
ncbi:MAG: hypothetical protein ACREO8_09120 [Luteimonas sp.]